MSVTTALESKVRYKTFTYRTRIEWLGSRAGRLQSGDKPAFRVSSPPEFKGEASVWTPEDLFVASVNACLMTTFVAFAQRQSLLVLSYASEADGDLEFADGSYRFARVTLRPTVVVREPAAIAVAEKTLEDAHRSCLISNSIRAVVSVEAIVRAEVQDDGAPGH